MAHPRIYLCRSLNRLSVIKTTIDSIVKLPLQIPSETSARSKKIAETKTVLINKPANKNVAVEHIHESKKDQDQLEATPYSNGYIKYPRYDFF